MLIRWRSVIKMPTVSSNQLSITSDTLKIKFINMKIEIFIFIIFANFVFCQSDSVSAPGNTINFKIGSIGIFQPQLNYSTVKIVFYDGATIDCNKTFRIANAADIVTEKHFDPNKKTVFYCHGYSESLHDTSVKTIVESYLVRGDHNILVLDWEVFAAGDYFIEVLPRVFKLGPVVARAIIRMLENGLSIKNLHIVGHSMGGQLVGLIGQFILDDSNNIYKVQRITALDPALPGFYPSIRMPINRYVADFVDIIHTDAGIFGIPVSAGSVDFWPNGGRSLQPGCPLATWQFFSDSDHTEFCSHYRSWQYWAESVSNRNTTFHAIRAISYAFFRFGIFQNSPHRAYMGIDANPLLTGNYYLQTNSESPYSYN